MPYGAFSLSTEIEQMPYCEFKKITKEKESELFGDREFKIEEIEDLHWQKISEEKMYAIDNPISLFGNETVVWNLDRLTKLESNIHFKRTHHELDVSIFFQFVVEFIYIVI